MKVFALLVNAVDCGEAAICELNKPENEFDLVLLDLILPDIVICNIGWTRGTQNHEKGSKICRLACGHDVGKRGN